MSETFVVDPAVDLAPLKVTSPFSSGGYEINPWYCATAAAAERFVAYVKAKLSIEASVSFDWPLGAFAGGSPFQQSGMVPYLDFPSAVNPINGHLNAGSVFIEYWQFNNSQADRTLQQWLALQ